MSSWNWEDRRRKGLKEGGQSDANNVIILSPFFALSLFLSPSWSYLGKLASSLPIN